MGERIYAQLPTGNNYYVKPLPIVSDPWANDVITLPEEASAWYWSSEINSPSDYYIVFLRSGDDPLITDTTIGIVQMLENIFIVSVGELGYESSLEIGHNLGL
jgi:hypothetical protein